jgi:membrane protease YdiL (CAAX protease family)
VIFGKGIPGASCAGAEALADPRKVVKHVIVGPFIEEAWRKTVQPHAGIGPTSVIFGAMHWSPTYGTPMAVTRVADATLGGILYGLALKHHGLTEASACHALHNLGTNVGLYLSGS